MDPNKAMLHYNRPLPPGSRFTGQSWSWLGQMQVSVLTYRSLLFFYEEWEPFPFITKVMCKGYCALVSVLGGVRGDITDIRLAIGSCPARGHLALQMPLLT